MDKKLFQKNFMAKRCNNEMIGGTDTLEKERKREWEAEYRDSPYTGWDTRTSPEQDLDDPRESL